MCVHTRIDMIKNEVTWDKFGMTSIADKMREAKLRSFVHMKRR